MFAPQPPRPTPCAAVLGPVATIALEPMRLMPVGSDPPVMVFMADDV